MTQSQFEQAVQDHYALVYRFALGLAKQPAEACDLTQQTFYLLGEKGSQLRDHSKLKSWLMTTCYREFLKHARRIQAFPHVEIEVVEDELIQITADTANQIDGDAMMEALQKVDENFRAPILLFYLQQHSYKEIAEMLDIPVGTVMSRLARGKEQLREHMKKELRAGSDRPVSLVTQATIFPQKTI